MKFHGRIKRAVGFVGLALLFAIPGCFGTKVPLDHYAPTITTAP